MSKYGIFTNEKFKVGFGQKTMKPRFFALWLTLMTKDIPSMK